MVVQIKDTALCRCLPEQRRKRYRLALVPGPEQRLITDQALMSRRENRLI